MADNSTNVALNIGSQKVSMAVYDTTKNGGIVLKSYASRDLLADPAAEALRMPQTRQAILELAQQLKVKGGNIRYALSGQSVFTRFVKLPPIEVEDMKSLVTMEAQQQLPFPIETVVWDYQLLESGTGEKEVALVAIKSDSLEEYNSTVTSTGMTTSGVDAAPMALYNAYRHAYPEITEPTLLIDIGAKNSNLLYMEGSRFFTRSIPIGGVALTTAISKEYGINFADAEGQKVHNGLVTLGGGHAEQLDESIAALGTVIRNALTRLPTEISRTTNYYRSQHGGSAPRRIFLAGGGASLPYTKEFFEEKLGLPVEIFNPLRNATVKGIDQAVLSKEAHTMGELIGLAASAAGKSAIKIDLVPNSVDAERASARRRPFLIGAAAVLIGGFAAYAGLKNAAATKAAENVAKLQKEDAALDENASPLQKLLSAQAAVEKVANGYSAAQDDRTYWVGLLNEISKNFASEYVWITDLDPIANYDPFAAKKAASKDKEVYGESVVRSDFAGSSGATDSLLAKIKAPEVAGKAAARTLPTAAAEDAAATINAIHIKGFWRKNSNSQNIVSKLLTALRNSKSTRFTFKVKDAKGVEAELTDAQVIKRNDAGTEDDGAYAWPFELVIPINPTKLAK